MTSETSVEQRTVTPFLLRFAEPLPDTAFDRLRYDEYRQISQVEVNGVWVDTPNALDGVQSTTRMTKVQAETTDDN